MRPNVAAPLFVGETNMGHCQKTIYLETNHTWLGAGGCWALVCHKSQAASGNAHPGPMYRQRVLAGQGNRLLLGGAPRTHAGSNGQVHAADGQWPVHAGREGARKGGACAPPRGGGAQGPGGQVPGQALTSANSLPVLRCQSGLMQKPVLLNTTCMPRALLLAQHSHRTVHVVFRSSEG